jgi:hypothetical protein
MLEIAAPVLPAFDQKIEEIQDKSGFVFALSTSFAFTRRHCTATNGGRPSIIPPNLSDGYTNPMH